MEVDDRQLTKALEQLLAEANALLTATTPDLVITRCANDVQSLRRHTLLDKNDYVMITFIFLLRQETMQELGETGRRKTEVQRRHTGLG